MHDMAAILGAILRGYVLPVRGDHGVVHWARVLENGRRGAEANGANREVVALFASLHDSRRVNEDQDDDHGLRGAEFADRCAAAWSTLTTLGSTCCSRRAAHADGYTTGDPTLLACWDADRLDLGRVRASPRAAPAVY